MKNELSPIRLILQDRYIRIITLLGFLALVLAFTEETQLGSHSRTIMIYLPCYIVLLVSFAIRRIPPLIKFILLEILLIIIGSSEFLFSGFNSMGFLFYSTAVLLGVLLQGAMAGLIMIILTTLLLGIITLAFGVSAIEITNSAQSGADNPWLWASPSSTYLMLTISTYYISHLILSQLRRTISSKEEMRINLLNERHSLSHANSELEKVAYIDNTTGLSNNSRFEKDISELKSERADQKLFIHLVMIELVDFSDFNIKYGINMGNDLLRCIARRLESFSDSNIYRDTGPRFMILCPNLVSEKRSKKLKMVEKILNEPLSLAMGVYRLKFRATEIAFPEDVSTSTQLRPALLMTLNVENSVFNRVVVHDSMKIKQIKKRTQMREHLLNAIVKDEFFCLIQPRLDLKTGLVSGGELLIRWQNTELGLTSPTEFIPLIEKEIIIFDMTLFVLKDLLKNENCGYGLPGLTSPPSYSINVSPVLIHSGQMEHLITTITESDYDSIIEFELTEGVFLGKSESIMEGIKSLHKNNIKISIDDFGTGYSNIEYLQDLNADIIKIDRKFIAGLPHDKKQKSIVKAIINIANALDLHIVAEGVEYEEQYQWLKEQGVDEIQGFYFAKPMCFDNYRTLIENHNPKEWI